MGHRIISEGFITRQPALQRAGALEILEFAVVSKRPVRNKQTQEWTHVFESQTFVAWEDDARRLAEKLVPGKQVTVTGIQETSHFTGNDGEQKSRTVFRVLHCEIHRREPQQERDVQGQGYAGEHDGQWVQQHEGQPLQQYQRQSSQQQRPAQQPARRPYREAAPQSAQPAQRYQQPPQPRYARPSQPEPEHDDLPPQEVGQQSRGGAGQNPHKNDGDRFSTVY